jgi:hypothetical protein
MPALLLTFLAAVLIGGCCGTRYEVYPVSRGTPEDAFRLFRAAILAEKPTLLYESFSEGFRRKYRVTLREFRTAYEMRKDDFDLLARVVAEAEVGEPRYAESGGYRFAWLPVTAYGRTVTFLLVEISSVTIDVDLGEWGRQDVRYDRAWDEMITVSKNGRIGLKRPVDASETGVVDPDEIRELRFHRQWFLHDIPDMPPEIRELLAPGGGQP